MAEVVKAFVPEELAIALQSESRQVVKRALARNISRDGAVRVGYLLTRLLIPPFASLRRPASFGSVVQLNSLRSIALNTIERVIPVPLISLSSVDEMGLSDKYP